ncbi:site-specific integrase [Blautia sp. AM47-4]|uniref:site-specific integrase n=1 Tax=Blautia sp. AM47-4 TaxID=2292979 RepID=UPI002E8E2C03|nr:site-specific integrase [Blautia sp. AM47-4]
MASIIKRKKNYSVVYNYVDENGETKQKWETWHTHKEALKRKAEIENQQHTGTFLPPSNQTITEFLYDFVSLYGEKKWGVSMYDSQTALIANYINPIIGDMEVQAVTPRAVDGYIQTLQKTKSVSTKTRKAVTTYVSDKTIEKIIKLLRCAFKQAVRWEIIARNPFDNVILPKTEYAKRDIWTADMIRLALDKCTDSKLYVAMNLSFACSLRMGEILGLTWENVHISDEDIAADNAYVYIDKELTRASKRAIETLGEKDIYYIFTPLMPNTSTRIILKKPKTDSSIRKVWLPKTLAYILREWKKSQDELKGFLGDEYQDFDLVVALPNGRPCEDRIILKEFAKLREDAGLPKVVFHSLRHSSTTYKLKLNHGDLKATQGDTGHAEIDMITSIYAHILDEDRKVNAQKFETAFYAKPDLRNVRPPEEPAKSEPATLDLESLVEQLQKSPELASALAALIAAQARQSDPKNRISKTQNFLSKFLKSVRVQLANIHHAAYKNLPVTEVKLPGEGGTKKRCKPRKKACSGAFWRPREDLNLRPHA